MKRVFERIFVILLLVLSSISLLFADSDTFNTMVITVTPGIEDFGLGLFPLGTRWQYYTSKHIIPQLVHPMNIVLDFEFELRNKEMDDRFSWKDGTPKWSIYPSQVDPEYYKGFKYFNPRSRISLSLNQGFGINKKSGSGPMFNVSVELNSRYAMALEQIGIEPTENNLHFANIDGTAKLPFGPNTLIPGFPWLQDSRQLFNNRIRLSFDFSHIQYFGLGASDGITANISFYYGPHWLANNLTIDGITSDFWMLSGYTGQNLNLLNIKQNNGLNWFSINLGHSNSLSYIGGSVVPEDMIPRDRFKASFTDYLYLQFTGPQFIAWDCYTEFTFGLSNGLYFGHVVNEVSQESSAIELHSGLSGLLHLRLFGFMHFDYYFEYVYAGGIWQAPPYWYQQNKFRFYVSL